MTDETNPADIPQPNGAGGPHADGKGPGGNGSGAPAARRAAVRSGLAERRNPALVRAGQILTSARRIALRDPLSLFLVIVSIGLAGTVLSLLRAIKPSSSGRG